MCREGEVQVQRRRERKVGIEQGGCKGQEGNWREVQGPDVGCTQCSKQALNTASPRASTFHRQVLLLHVPPLLPGRR